MAVDGTGNVYVAEADSHAIRKLTPAGVVTTLAGAVQSPGSIDATGSAARFDHPWGVAVDGSGCLYIADTGNNTIRIGQAAGPPMILTQPQGQAVTSGSKVQFSVVASGVPAPTYQWYFNGSALGGATDSSLSLASASAANAGSYTVVVTNAMGSVTSDRAAITITSPSTPASSAGSGGGLIEAWFALALLALAAARCCIRAHPLSAETCGRSSTVASRGLAVAAPDRRCCASHAGLVAHLPPSRV